MATIDIIVPCYGYGCFLAECVESVLNQSERNLRVLIIDDASPDETAMVAAALAREDGRVTARRHVTNRGHIATYNEGLEWASADYTLLLSADDWILPGSLSRAVHLMDTNPDVGFVYGPFIELRPGDPNPLAPDAAAAPGWTIMSGEEFFCANRCGNPVGACTAVVRTAMQKRIGGYRPELPHAGDMEMWLRFAAHGRVGRINAYQGVYRRHARSMSVAHFDNVLSDLRQRKLALDFVFESHGSMIPHADELRRYLCRGLAEAALHSASQPFARGDIGKHLEMVEFAERLDPAIRRSYVWRAQAIKRQLGPRLWSALWPARTLIHSLSKDAHWFRARSGRRALARPQRE